MLQGRTHLQFKGNLIELRHLGVVDQRLGQSADVMQGVISEAGQLVQLTFIDRIVPVDIEDTLRDSCHLVDIGGIEGDDTHTKDIGDVGDGVVFATFQHQFPPQ